MRFAFFRSSDCVISPWGNKLVSCVFFIFLTFFLSLLFVPAARLCASDLDEGEATAAKTDNLGIYLLYPEQYEAAMELGATIVNLNKYKTFYVYWFPESYNKQKDNRAMVMMHGTNDTAYKQLLNMADTAEKEGFGLITVQWGWPQGETPGKQEWYYEDEDTVYTIMKKAIKKVGRRYKFDRNLCAWHGFSRSSTQCAMYAFLDEKKKHFNYFIAVSGQIGADQGLMQELISGKHGDEPIEGRHFYLWCGKRDLNGQRCAGMKDSKGIIEDLGGVVDKFKQAKGDHGDYFKNAKFKGDAVELWLKRGKD